MPGNHSKLTPEFIEDAARLAEGGLKNVDICKALGIHQSTLYAWLKNEENPLSRELYEELEKARAKRKAFMIETITKAARDGTWQAAAWWLERCYPEEFAKPDRYHDQGVDEAVKAVRELTETIRAQAERGACVAGQS